MARRSSASLKYHPQPSIIGKLDLHRQPLEPPNYRVPKSVETTSCFDAGVLTRGVGGLLRDTWGGGGVCGLPGILADSPRPQIRKFYCLRQGTSKRGEGQPFLSY